MTTTVATDIREAVKLLDRTAQNNRTGLIGSPTSLTGAPLNECILALVHDGVTGYELQITNGVIILIARNARFGDSSFYINPTPAHSDPWSKS
jgi:hypothetical protein